MSYGSYLKDVKAKIRETDVETHPQGGRGAEGEGRRRQRRRADPDRRPREGRVDRGLHPGRALDPARIPRACASRIRCPSAPRRSSFTARGAIARRWRAQSLAELGYTNVKSMAGGFTAWKRGGLPFDRPFIMTQEQSLRYARHTMLPEVGELGQAKLLQSKVLCLGAGGLGSPSGLYLAAAGVGTVGFVDDDVGRRVQPAAADPARDGSGWAWRRSSRPRSRSPS